MDLFFMFIVSVLLVYGYIHEDVIIEWEQKKANQIRRFVKRRIERR